MNTFNIAMNYAKDRIQEVVPIVGSRLMGISRFESAAEVFEGRSCLSTQTSFGCLEACSRSSLRAAGSKESRSIKAGTGNHWSTAPSAISLADGE